MGKEEPAMSRKRSLYRSAARILTGCGPAGWHRTDDACRARPRCSNRRVGMSRRSARARTEENANARPGVGVRSGKPFRELKVSEKKARQARLCLLHVNRDRLAHLRAIRTVRAVAKIERQRVIARWQRDLRFRLALAEMQRLVVGGNDFALRQRLPVDD